VHRIPNGANNLLIDNRSNIPFFSECALISKENWSDFDSAIPRFESWRPSQPDQSLQGLKETLAKKPPVRRFLPAPKSLWFDFNPRRGNLMSASDLKNSQISENASGDWFDCILSDRALRRLTDLPHISNRRSEVGLLSGPLKAI